MPFDDSLSELIPIVPSNAGSGMLITNVGAGLSCQLIASYKARLLCIAVNRARAQGRR